MALIGPAGAGSQPGLRHQGLLTHGLHAARMLWPAVHAIILWVIVGVAWQHGEP